MATVLIVDDSHLSRTTARLALARAGVGVIEAVDGIAGIEAVQRHAPDCVLVALTVPALDARGFLRAVRSLNGPPVVVVAPCPTEATIDELKRSGAAAVAERSFDSGAALAAVTGVLARPRPAAAA